MPLFTMRSPAFLAMVMVCICPVHGQTRTPVEGEVAVHTVLVATLGMAGRGPVRPAPILGEVSLTGSAETVFGNGLRLRGRFAGHVQYDHPRRPGGIGGFGKKTDTLTGQFSGFSAGLPISGSGERARLETIYGQIDGGYGELRFGKDKGVAARFHEGAPPVLNHTRLDSPLLDAGGLGTIRTRHDLTGQSFKLSYASPRLLGVRLGITLTPDAGSADGLDRRPAAGSGDFSANPGMAVESALNVRHVFKKSRVRVDAALAFSRARIDNEADARVGRHVETRSGGIQLVRNNWSLGAAWLTSNNGVSDGDYQAWSAGIGHASGRTRLSVHYGQASDRVAVFNARGWQAGTSHRLNDRMRIGMAFFHQDTESGSEQWISRGMLVTVTFSATIANLAGY